MQKEVYSQIKGIQKNDEGSDVTELLTQGLYFERDGKQYLLYDESEATGFEDCKTTLKLDHSDKVVMRRTGPQRSELVIEKGIRNVGLYGTIAGDLQIGVFADTIRNELTEQGGTVYFKYQLDVNSVFLSENEIYIDVKAEQENTEERN